ncbi:MAG: tRNA (N(6)-L-threonylcarbamoyladenosine(37)-C(2))-methylthiotransferase [Candidatus Woesearchaeota archaeon]|jgi:MiaB-like tRNA modifying enzyme|nr:tRNA (N(6)-L-threonylcarbamoyladenosine(37)-C(2))-methylthiotransferase [Candidatus Woesearchaeota archaeon]|tara:strand:+ start:5811 stop:7121 length:1311 start_codon:yes stop_codon:yes gene_type:complete
METIYVQTHGCSANVVDSESMMGLLVESGFKLADEIEYSDIIILNICTVKGSHVALKEIKNFTKHFPEKKLIVAGCITKPLVASIRKISQEAALVNTHNIHRIVEIVEELLHGNIMEALTIENTIKADLPGIRTNNVIGIVPIASGCSDRCAYCSVKLIKGNIFSYPESSIINAVKKNVKDGCKEIWITSQDSGAYGLDNGKRGLPKLLDEILEEVQGNYKIRLGMINPGHVKYIADDIIQIFQDDRMFKFLHIPVEAGNNEVLGKMNRKYNVHEFKEMIEKFKRYVKGITIATDIIVGFPTETELQFQDSLHLIQEIKPDVINISRFSSRPNTKAERMKQVSSNIKKERSKALTDLFLTIALKQNKKWIGWKGKILIDEIGKDNTWIGRNFAYKPVIVKGNYKLGDNIDVEIKDVTAHDLRVNIPAEKIEISSKI